jgi:SAM-dependent methyltransferase
MTRPFIVALLYRLGMAPWDRGQTPAGLADLVEGRAPLSAGRALEIGCGTGAQAVHLAGRGWRVTGVDFPPKLSTRLATAPVPPVSRSPGYAATCLR